MNRLRDFLLIAVLSLSWIPSARAESSRPSGNLTLAQAERNAVELKQGMSAGEVQKLLGKPRRTALKSNGAVNTPGNLQWTYSWTGGTASSAGNLRVEFSARTAEDWTVSSWDWATY